MSNTNQEINDVVRALGRMLRSYNTAIRGKTILKRAARPALDGLRRSAGEIRDTGNLMRSAKFINTRSNNSVMVGYKYTNELNYAHLIEYGWITRDGQRIQGNPIVRNTFEATKEQILQNLVQELRRTQAQIEREIGR